MAESEVTFLLHKLATIFSDEVQKAGGVRREVEDLSAELNRMQDFLRVAADRTVIDTELNNLLKKVRDVAYDIEDMFDEFLLRFKNDDGVKCHISLQYRFAKARARHQLASGIQAAKSRIRTTFESYRYGSSYISAGALSSTAAVADHNRGGALQLGESKLVGIGEPKRQLIKWLVDDVDPSLRVISVMGMGGLGKTTLVKKVFDDLSVRNRFDNRAWISISKSFKREEVLKDMIYQLLSTVKKQPPQEVEAMDNSGLLTTTIQQFLRQSRYLIVLDDVWHIDAWNAMKSVLPDSNCGSRVLITTRNAEVASATSMESKTDVYALNPLSMEDSWKLFCLKTFPDGSVPPHLETHSRSILRRCEGLPLAIVAVSGILATKDRSRVDEWEKLAYNFGPEIESSDGFHWMVKILSLSYYDLPCYLKSCFLYLSIFPEDHAIECMRLIHLWIAEGFVIEVTGKTQEETAQTYLNELLNRNLVQIAGRTSDGRVYSCRIHCIVRGIVLSICRDQNFTTIANEEHTSWPEKVRRLSVHGTVKNVKLGKNAASLRSLIIFNVKDSISDTSFPSLYSGDLRLLKMLDLTGASLEIVPDGLFRLINLRYLSLRNTKVKKLPGLIGKLRLLETLNLKHTSITELPSEILKLQQLRYLLLYRYEKESLVPYYHLKGFKVPVGIGGLQSLIKLCFVESNEANNTLRELAGLHHLQRLGITKLRKEDGMTLCASIGKLSNLVSLNLQSVEEDGIIDIQHLASPPLFLQRLYLHGRLERLPSWISSLHGLIKLYLRWSHLQHNFVEPLGYLPNLVELQLRQAYDGEVLSFKAGSFQKLKILFLDELEEVREIGMEEGAMPCLEQLTISRCQFLDGIPAGIDYLTNLKTIKFLDMPDELMHMILPENNSGEYRNLSHVPEVYFIRWKNSQWERNILSAGHSSNKTGSK